MVELVESDMSPVFVLVQTSLVRAATAPWPYKKVQKCTIAGITAGWCLVTITAVVTGVPAVDDKKGWKFFLSIRGRVWLEAVTCIRVMVLV